MLGWLALPGVPSACAWASSPVSGLALATCLLLALPPLLRRRHLRLDLRHRHVLVTGGSQGIGLALAVECARRGAKVTLVARTKAKLDKAVEAVRDAVASAQGTDPAPRVVAVPADVCDPEALVRAVAEAEAGLGSVDVLVCAAGASEPGYFLDQPCALFERQMRLNYLGTVHALKAVLPSMVVRPPASADCRVVLVASGAAAIGFLGYAAYAPTKAAVKSLGEALRNELCGTCVRVHVAYPPDTDTPGFEKENETKPAENRAMFPLDLFPADKVAKLVIGRLCRANPPYHLPSPDPVQNLLVNSVAGVTPRWSVLGDAFLAPVAAVIGGLLPVWTDSVARPYGKRLWANPAAAPAGASRTESG